MNPVSFGGIPNLSITGAGSGAGLDSGLDSGLGAGSSSFSDVLKSAVQTVDSLHQDAATQVQQLMRGGGGDINDVMIAVEKADVSFQLMMQVRNKIVSAYQDIEKMQF